MIRPGLRCRLPVFPVTVLSIVALLVALMLPGAARSACAPGHVDLRGDWGSARFSVELADDDTSRSLGLMHREHLPRMAGMLFLYDRPGQVFFWMRNTLIPLDMIFFDAAGVVTRVHHRAVPLDETPIDGGNGVLAVLEINGGMAADMGIAIGTQLRHPAMPQGIAAWPCPPG